MEKKYKTVNIPIDIVEKIHQTVELDGANGNIHACINEIIENTLSKLQYLRLTVPHLSLAAVSSHGIIVRDTSMTKNELAEVVFQANKLFCSTCGEEHCPHVDFVRVIPDFGKMVKNKLAVE